MGGRNEEYQETADIFIFDKNKLTFRKQENVQWPTEREPFECDRIVSDYNQAKMIRPGKVLAFGRVCGEDMHQALICYERSSNSVSVVHRDLSNIM